MFFLAYYMCLIDFELSSFETFVDILLMEEVPAKQLRLVVHPFIPSSFTTRFFTSQVVVWFAGFRDHHQQLRLKMLYQNHGLGQMKLWRNITSNEPSLDDSSKNIEQILNNRT